MHACRSPPMAPGPRHTTMRHVIVCQYLRVDRYYVSTKIWACQRTSETECGSVVNHAPSAEGRAARLEDRRHRHSYTSMLPTTVASCLLTMLPPRQDSRIFFTWNCDYGRLRLSRLALWTAGPPQLPAIRLYVVLRVDLPVSSPFRCTASMFVCKAMEVSGKLEEGSWRYSVTAQDGLWQHP
jgi:hypothetical protein